MKPGRSSDHTSLQFFCLFQRPHVLPVLAICVFLFVSCTKTDTCLEPQTLSLRGSFYRVDSIGTAHDSVLTNANLYFGNGAIYMENLKGSSQFAFPLSQQADTISFLFQADSTSASLQDIDTLQIVYQRQLHFISVACGYQTQFQLGQITSTHHVLDSVRIQEASVTSQFKTHLALFLHP